MSRTTFDDDDPFAAPRGPAPRNKLVEMVRRVAEIEDELERRGADPLIEEMGDLKREIKQLMLERGDNTVFDEYSEYEAVLQQRTSEEWDIVTFKTLLTKGQRVRYVVVEERVDTEAVAEGLKNGDLSRAELEYKGAVKKVPGVQALYVRRRRIKDGSFHL